jgi:DNA-binding MarR family transcriptional regulator
VPEPDDTQVGVAELLAESVGFLLSKIGMGSSQLFAQRLAGVGLNPPLFAVLRFVSVSEGTSQQALGEATSIPASRMVALVDELEEKGLVERRRNPSDRRAHALYLTPKGKRTYAKAFEIATAHEAELCAALSDAEREQLLGFLRRIASGQELPLGVHPGLTQR